MAIGSVTAAITEKFVANFRNLLGCNIAGFRLTEELMRIENFFCFCRSGQVHRQQIKADQTLSDKSKLRC